MSKFNGKELSSKNASLGPASSTHEGGPNRALSAKAELLKICLTSFLGKTFYETPADTMRRVSEYADALINAGEGAFIPKLAVFSREYGLRSVNHYLAAYYVYRMRGRQGFRDELSAFLRKLVWRPDELGEIVGALTHINGSEKPVFPNSLKSAFAELLSSGKFSDYQLAKYKNAGGFKTVDIVKLSHPAKCPESVGLLMKGKLPSADTWETAISKPGADKKAEFERLLSEEKVSGKALLMNVRQMLAAGVDSVKIEKAIEKDSFKGIFPYEFLRTLRALSESSPSPSLVRSLERKASESFRSLGLGKVAVLVDTSGSMNDKFGGAKSTLSRKDLASFYGAMAASNGGVAYAWATDCRKVDVIPGDGILRIASQISKINVGLGTEIQKALDRVKDEYETALVFSDMQFADSIKDTGKLKRIYCFNLGSYAGTVSDGGKIVELAGFDDLMFRIGSDLRNIGPLVSEIEKIRF